MDKKYLVCWVTNNHIDFRYFEEGNEARVFYESTKSYADSGGYTIIDCYLHGFEE